jgi:hypothetical protein
MPKVTSLAMASDVSAPVAQLVEHLTFNPVVTSSNLVGRTIFHFSPTSPLHRHTGQGSAATDDPVSSATVKRRSLLPLYYENKEQNASRFGICAGFRLGARDRSLGRNDAESLGFGRNEHPSGAGQGGCCCPPVSFMPYRFPASCRRT